MESKHYPAYFRIVFIFLFKSKQNDMPMQWLSKVKISKEETVKIREDMARIISDKFEKFRPKFSNIA